MYNYMFNKINKMKQMYSLFYEWFNRLIFGSQATQMSTKFATFIIAAVHWYFFSQTKMPRRCSVYNCEGNYNGQPYTQTVSASIEKYPEYRKRWIEAMPIAEPATT